MLNTPSLNARYCPLCQKAKKACICHVIKHIPCDIPILILQHPSEAKKPIGTAKIASLSLPLCTIYSGEDFTTHSALNKKINEGEYEYMLLYPHENAIDIATIMTNKKEIQKEKKIGLIVIDGTWKKAFKIWSLSKNLHPLPKVMLTGSEKGNYQIRKSSKKNSLATVEAIYQALSTLTQNKNRYIPLIDAFNTMIEFQIKQMPNDIYIQHYKKTQTP